MRRAAHNAFKIDVLVESDLWKERVKVKSIVRRAVRQAAAALSTRGAELAIVLTDDSAIRLLNRDWRGIDAATIARLARDFATTKPSMSAIFKGSGYYTNGADAARA